MVGDSALGTRSSSLVHSPTDSRIMASEYRSNVLESAWLASGDWLLFRGSRGCLYREKGFGSSCDMGSEKRSNADTSGLRMSTSPWVMPLTSGSVPTALQNDTLSARRLPCVMPREWRSKTVLARLAARRNLASSLGSKSGRTRRSVREHRL